MNIQVATLPEGGMLFEGEEPGSILDIGDAPEFLGLQGPVRYSITASRSCGELMVAGSLSAPATFRCRRCCEPVEIEVRDNAFERIIDVPDGNESVDLTPSIREAMILAFPNYPLCSGECRGLCPQCGQNLNRRLCGCVPPAGDGRWSALDRLGP
ncbi:MAG: DUF177 domain-containing protein [Lentisphaerae bacterium]|nr:DUF177 domain-containing protein [Lentisphaerota bacterium]